MPHVLPSVAEHTNSGVAWMCSKHSCHFSVSDINIVCFYIDIVVVSVLVGASDMLMQMIFIFCLASMFMGQTTFIMHNIFLSFIYGRLAGGISVVA
jgi:hypothetical protein